MVEKNTVKTNGIEMDYFSFGEGDKNMVVVPGLNVTSVLNIAEEVAEYFSPLAQEFKIYVFDRRTNLPSEYSTYDMANDTVEVIKNIGIKDIYLYGTSQGGMISQVIAINNPGLVKKLALASTTSRMSKEATEKIGHWVDIACTMDMRALANQFGEDIYTKEFCDKHGDSLFQQTLNATEDDVKRFKVLAGKIGDFDVYDKLPSIKCPTYVFGASGDKLFSVEEFDDIANKIGCESYIYDGYSHCMYDEVTDYIGRLYEFLV